jgi:hypothetical protein
MKFLQRLISRGILKSIQKMALKDPVIFAKFDKLGKDADDLAKAIAKFAEEDKDKPKLY